MARALYTYTKPRYNRTLLTEITAAGLPSAVMDGDGDQLQLGFAAALRAAEVVVLDGVVAAHNPVATIYEEARATWIAEWGPTR